MRKSTIFIGFLCANIALLVLLIGHAIMVSRQAGPEIESMAALVHRLQLTDLCLFTDARYTRNPSQADRHSPFQDSPMGLEHFPSGSIVPPPPHLRQ